MRKYELMTIFPVEEEKFKTAAEAVRGVLSQFGAEIESEESYGDRELCYEIKKQKHGRFQLFIIKVNPAKITEIDQQFKLTTDLLKYLFVKIDE